MLASPLLFLILLCVISGCSRTVVEYRPITPPQSLLKPCKEVPIDIKTNGDMVLTIIDLQTSYSVCSLQMKALIDFFSQEAGQ